MLEYLLLGGGFIILIEGAEFLVNGASSLARRLRISDLVIGLTIVAFGTSAPELVVNIFASINGNTGIAIGNVLGSNIFNILVILGISALIYPLAVTENTIRKEIPLTLISVVVLAVLANDIFLGNCENQLTRIDGFILLGFFLLFLVYVLEIAKNKRAEPTETTEIKKKSLFYSSLLIIIGFCGIIVGGNLVVSGAVQLARSLGASESLIGLTLVAAGTSLPELATSAVAACKKNTDIAVGNIIGSNIFNILFILGVSATVRSLPFKGGSNLDIGMVIFSTLLLFRFMVTGGKKNTVERWEGAVLLIIYFVYLGYIVFRG